MIVTQHAHIYSFHTSKFNFGEIFFLIFLSIQPLFTVEEVHNGHLSNCIVYLMDVCLVMNTSRPAEMDGCIDVPKKFFEAAEEETWWEVFK
jgi:hypothetical protein